MIQADEPIEGKGQDVLGRAQLASVIAGEVRQLDPSRGAVVGILGPWGSGKTSLINLIRAELDREPRIPVLDFNPWLFSGTAELVQAFFSELAEQLRLESGKLDALADELEHYGDVIAPLQVLPVVGAWIERVSGAGQALKKLRGKGEGGITTLRKKVEAKLADLDSPVVVVVDDIDRLHTDEIRQVFKLVRLTASFPNLIYLVAFDRARVESALAEDGLPGRDYLEKIVQIAYDIPAIPELAVRAQIREAILGALDGLEDAGPFGANRWPDVFEEVILPLVRTMRDVRRYAASLRGTVRSLEGQVELVDVLAMEALRVFLPSVFAQMAELRVALTSPDAGLQMFATRDERSRHEITALMSASVEHPEVIKSAVRRLFPNAARFVERGWGAGETPETLLRQRRVGHRHVLDFYVERVAGPGLQSFWRAERASEVLADRAALEGLFRSMEPDEWQAVIGALELYQDEYPLEAVEPASIVLLNLSPEIPERPRAPLDFYDRRLVVTRVVLRLLRRLPDERAIENVVRRILPEVSTLSGRLTLLNTVGHEENLGHALIGLEASQELEASLREQVRAATPEQLADEAELFWLLSWTKETRSPDEPELVLALDGPFACALLKAAVSEATSQGMGTRAVRREKRLIWEPLLDLVGGAEGVQRLVDACARPEGDETLALARELAIKYLGGWKPGRRT